MSNKNNLKTSSVLYTLGSILNASVGFIFIPLFMSEFTVDEFGVYSLILICSAIGSALFYLGVTSALTRSFFDYTTQSERNNCFYTSLILLAIGGVGQILLGFFSSSYISILLFDDVSWTNEIFISLVASSFGFINFAFMTYFRLINKPYHFFIFSAFLVLSNVFFMYYFLIFYQQGVVGAVKGVGISQLFVFIVLFTYHWKLLIESKWSKYEAVIQLKYGFYTVISSLGGLAILWADQFFINKYLSLSSVGIYALSVKFAGIVTVVLVTPFIQVLIPIVMEQRVKQDVRFLIKKSYEVYMMIGMCISVLISFLAEEFIYLFDDGGGYSDSIIYIFPLMLSLCVYGAVNIVSIGLSFKRKLGRQTIVYLVFALVNILLNFILIPKYDIWGAILSTFLTYSFITFSLGVVSNKVYKINYSISFTIYIAIISVIFILFNSYLIVGDEIFYRLGLKFFIFMLMMFLVFFYFKPMKKYKLLF